MSVEHIWLRLKGHRYHGYAMLLSPDGVDPRWVVPFEFERQILLGLNDDRTRDHAVLIRADLAERYGWSGAEIEGMDEQVVVHLTQYEEGQWGHLIGNARASAIWWRKDAKTQSIPAPSPDEPRRIALTMTRLHAMRCGWFGEIVGPAAAGDGGAA